VTFVIVKTVLPMALPCKVRFAMKIHAGADPVKKNTANA
jgi:hypothetical protein